MRLLAALLSLLLVYSGLRIPNVDIVSLNPDDVLHAGPATKDSTNSTGKPTPGQWLYAVRSFRHRTAMRPGVMVRRLPFGWADSSAELELGNPDVATP